MKPVPSTITKTYPQRGPLQQVRRTVATTFDCIRCGASKKSKLVVVYGGDKSKLLCNGCYGELLSLHDIKAGTAAEDKRVEQLPTAPLDAFVAHTSGMPRNTEAERLVVQRVGQGFFRAALLDFWDGCCPLTGIIHRRLLRASHMKPWADCATDAERLDVYNGLLLAAHLDAAFDAGLITFADDGALHAAPSLSIEDRERIGLPTLPLLAGLTASHLPYLEYHRDIVFQATNSGPGKG